MGTPGLPHIRLDFTVVDAEALHYSSAIEKRRTRRRSEGRAKMEKTKGGVGVTGMAHATQRAVRPGTGRTPP